MILPSKGMLHHAMTAAILAISAVVGGSPPLVVAEDAQPLTLAVVAATPKSGIVQCEPLVVDLRVRNVGSDAVDVPEVIGIQLWMKIQIKEPTGQWVDYGEMGHGRAPIGMISLAAGESYLHRILIAYGVLRKPAQPPIAGSPFAVPGQYEVTVSYLPRYVHRDDPWFKAPPLQVTVSQAEGPEKEALALFCGRAQGQFLHDWDMAPADGPPREFAQLAKAYPETIFGRYASFFVAAAPPRWAEAREEFAADLVGLDRGNAERRLFQLAFDKRAREFGELARSEPALPLADECLLKQAECYLSAPSNRRGEAVKVLEDLVAKYPESRVAVTARKRLEALAQPEKAAASAPAASKPEPTVPERYRQAWEAHKGELDVERIARLVAELRSEDTAARRVAFAALRRETGLERINWHFIFDPERAPAAQARPLQDWEDYAGSLRRAVNDLVPRLMDKSRGHLLHERGDPFRLGIFAPHPALVPLLREIIANPDETSYIRNRALRGLAVIPHDGLMEYLASLLDDPGMAWLAWDRIHRWIGSPLPREIRPRRTDDPAAEWRRVKAAFLEWWEANKKDFKFERRGALMSM